MNPFALWVRSYPFAPLGLCLVLLVSLVGCTADDLTADLAAAQTGTFEAVLTAQIDEATPEARLSAPDLAAQTGSVVREIAGPMTITEPGTYLVTQDFATDGDGLVIQASDVFVDLGGHTLTGPGNKVGRGIVIENAERVFVSGGTLRTFGIGVQLVGTERSAVVAVRTEGGDETADPANGNPPQIGFLLVNSARNRLQGNSADGVNLGLFVRGPGSYQNRLVGNTLRAGMNGLLGICYNPAPDTTDPAGPSYATACCRMSSPALAPASRRAAARRTTPSGSTRFPTKSRRGKTSTARTASAIT